MEDIAAFFSIILLIIFSIFLLMKYGEESMTILIISFLMLVINGIFINILHLYNHLRATKYLPFNFI